MNNKIYDIYIPFVIFRTYPFVAENSVSCLHLPRPTFYVFTSCIMNLISYEWNVIHSNGG